MRSGQGPLLAIAGAILALAVAVAVLAGAVLSTAGPTPGPTCILGNPSAGLPNVVVEGTCPP